MKARAVKGHEVLRDEAVADDEVVVEGHLERATDPIVGVVAHAIAISGEEQEEIERAFRVTERRKEAFMQKTIWDEGEAALADTPDPIWTNGWSARLAHHVTFP